MQKQEVIEKIRAVIEKSPVGRDVAAGRQEGNCKFFSVDLYEEFKKPQNNIEGLSLAVVSNILDTDHAWLIAHHPDVGYFMIDPTAGQFLRHKNGDKFNETFIGTYEELEKGITSGAYHFARMNQDKYRMYYVWSPVVCFYETKRTNPATLCMRPEDEAIWRHYPFKIEFNPAPETSTERYGQWAAGMEEAGVDWKGLITSSWNRPRDSWPDSHSPKELTFYQEIITARNKCIRLGNDSKNGRSYQEMLKIYRLPVTSTQL